MNNRAGKGVGQSPEQLAAQMKEEAKKIGDQLNTLIAAKQPEAIALQALCETIRFGNKPGFDQEQSQQQERYFWVF